MKLKKDIDLTAFFEGIRKCSGSVYFQTADQDQLNLRSALCFFVFTAAYKGNVIELEGSIICENKEDELLLREFCES